MEYHLFEANPRLIPFLDRSLALQLEGRFAVQHGCLAATEGVSRLNFSLESSGQSHLAAHGTEVPNVMLDDYIAHRRIERVTVLKLDIEGSEPLALRGLQRTLQRKAVDVIYVEVLPENLRRLGFTPRDVVSPLHAAGFATYYCREADQRRIPEADWRSVSVNGASLRLALMRDDGPPFGTDLLAVHRDSSLFRFLATA